MVNVLKFQTLVASNKAKQTAQNQIRQHLKKQSDQGLDQFAILTSTLWIPAMKTKILFDNRKKKRKVFEILEHLSSSVKKGAKKIMYN